MKLKITEIEASAEELRQSNSIADGLTRILRNAFNPYYHAEMEDDDAETEDDDAETEDDDAETEDDDAEQTDCAWK